MMPLDPLRVGVLAVTLAAACVTDVRRRTIPNTLTFPALLVGLLLAGGQDGAFGLGQALAGAGVASLALFAYAGRMLGAGDVKLLWALGALTGPGVMLWTLPCVALAGGTLALLWAARHGALPHVLRNTARRGQGILATRAAAGLAEPSQAGRMPYSPAIALGTLAALWLPHTGLVP